MFKSILVGATALASLALAQNPLFFKSTPNNVMAGQQYTISYSTPDPSQPVIITLRDNTDNPNDLGTTKILTSSSTGGSYTWDVSNTIQNGNYALSISQPGQKDNYSGIFSVSGGSKTSAMSSMMSSTMASSMASSMTSAMTSATSAPSVMSRISASMTTSYPYGSAPAGTGSYSYPSGGMSRNSSYVSPTVPSQTSMATGGSGTSNAGSGSSAGSNTAAATTAAATGGAASLGSSMALVIGAVAAFAFLN